MCRWSFPWPAALMLAGLFAYFFLVRLAAPYVSNFIDRWDEAAEKRFAARRKKGGGHD